MRPQFDLYTVQLLASRLCHDLVGQVGAINNGIELGSDPKAGMDREAMSLVATTARDLAERLQFFRVAFGLAKGAVGTTEAAGQLLTASVIGHKNRLLWPEAAEPIPLPFGGQALKLLLNMVVMAGDCLLRGGDIEVFIEEGGQEQVTLTVTAAGDRVRIDEALLVALEPDVGVDALTPRSVHGFYAAQIARFLGGELSADYPQDGMIALRATVASVGD